MAYIKRRDRLDPLHKDNQRLNDIQELKRIERNKNTTIFKKILSWFKK